jgi:hypothetical protein
MRHLLKGLALVVLGFVLSLIFLFTCHLQYVHVIQTATTGEGHQTAESRSFEVNTQPFWPSPVIDLFHKPSEESK